MHIHSSLVAIIVAFAAATVSAAEPVPAPKAQPPADPALAQCRGRTGCAVARQRPLQKGLTGSLIVDLRIPHQASAVEDEDRCDRREYWLLTPKGASLLAADCEAQWGADNPGPARTELKGQQLRVKYTEFQSSDGCETVDAVISLDPLLLKKQVRRRGTAHHNVCAAASAITEKVPAGDGTPDHPILVLHR